MSEGLCTEVPVRVVSASIPSALRRPPSMHHCNAIIAKVVGHMLKEMRLRAKLSQSEVAKRIGSHRPIISRSERGMHVTSLEVLVKQVHACGGELGAVLTAIDRGLGR